MVPTFDAGFWWQLHWGEMHGEADWIQGYFMLIDRATVITTNDQILRMIDVMGYYIFKWNIHQPPLIINCVIN